jgi:acetyl-CoA decarbonylase/synthase complex subunit gamma
MVGSDRLGTVAARLGVGRMDYQVRPGLYAIGQPTPASPVFVSANYKLSFDHLRGALAGRSGWILVLDTKGINVWCAAGKGTFGTEEIVRRVGSCGLDRVVSHRTLVLPQLGAPGVAQHEVRKRTGFSVKYGPVRAAELPAWLDAGMIATPEMRRVRFDLRDRAVLVPVELVMGGKQALLVAAVLLLLGGFGPGGWSLAGVRGNGLGAAALVLGSFLGGTLLGPLLLPWLPGRPFAAKGAFLGALLVGPLALSGLGPFGSGWHLAAAILLVPALVSFVVMNFTGASTFTSLSGVLREMRFAVPLQIAAAAIGLALWAIGLFAGGRPAA